MTQTSPGTHPKRNGDTEELQPVDLLLDLFSTLSSIQVDVALRLHHLALRRLEDPIRKLGTGVGHRQCSGPQAIFRLDDFITAELDALGESGDVGVGAEGRFGLREDGEDSDSGVATQYGDGRGRGYFGCTVGLRYEGRSADNVEGSYSEDPVGQASVQSKTDRVPGRSIWGR